MPRRSRTTPLAIIAEAANRPGFDLDRALAPVTRALGDRTPFDGLPGDELSRNVPRTYDQTALAPAKDNPS